MPVGSRGSQRRPSASFRVSEIRPATMEAESGASHAHDKGQKVEVLLESLRPSQTGVRENGTRTLVLPKKPPQNPGRVSERYQNATERKRKNQNSYLCYYYCQNRRIVRVIPV